MVYDTTGEDFNGNTLKSYIEIKDAGDNRIEPDENGDYTDIPAGAKIELSYAFSLSDGDGTTEYQYHEGDFFALALPGGLEFDPACTSGVIKAIDSITGEYELADWAVADNMLEVVLTAEGAKEEHKAKWGRVILTGTFKPLGAGDATETRVVFGNETIIIYREPLPLESSLKKTGSYDAAENKITWTVQIDPPAGDPELSYQGYTVIDTFGDNQTYVGGSFTVKNGDGDAVSVDDTALSQSADGRTISYTFPDDTSGTQIITFKTTPSSFAGTDGVSVFENTVNLERNEGESAADPQTGTVTLDWIDKTGEATASAEAPDLVKWTVTVKVPGKTGQSIAGAKIVDQLHQDLVLFVDDSYPIQIKFGTENSSEVAVGSSPGCYSYESATHTLTYFFPDNKPVAGTAAVLTFYTKVNDAQREEYLNDNAAINFTNTATLYWNEGGTLDKFPSTSCSTEEQGTGIGSGGLLSKFAPETENYLYESRDIIKWTITVNRNGIRMVNGTIDDVIPPGQELLINENHLFTVRETGGATLFETGTPENSSNANYTFTCTDLNHYLFAFTGTITKTYTITYFTRIIDWTTLYENGTVDFGNQVKLTRDGNELISVDGTRSFNSQMLHKGIATPYNYTTHLIQWRIVVNRNRLPLTNATLTDTLPGGLVLFIDPDHPFAITADPEGVTGSHNAAAGNTGFTVTLPGSTSAEYTINFWTKLTDDVLMNKWSGTKGFTNEASLDSDETEPIKDKATTNIRNPVITKTGRQGDDSEQGGGKDTIYWSVILNHAQLDLVNAVVEDALPEALRLDFDSVKLEQISIKPLTGEYDPTQPPVPVVNLTSRMSYRDNTLTIALPDGPYAYLLQFCTWILDDTIVSLTNTIRLSGDSPTPTGDFESGTVKVAEVYAGGGSGSNKLTVWKSGAGDSPLAGARFRLLNVNQEPIKRGGQEIIRTTNSEGLATFEALPSWVFFVEEIEPAPGYLLPEDPIFYGERLTGEVTVAVKNTLALTAVSFEKVGANNDPISGGTFTLTGKDYKGAEVSIEASAVKGIVTFENVPPHQAGTTYTIKETAAPAGHKINNTALSVTVEYNEGKTGLVVTVSPPETLENIPAEISVYFDKTGLDGTLSGGSFKFSGMDYQGKEVNQVVSADNDGVVAFTGIQIGEYTISELDPPNGYLMPTEANILTVIVAYNEDCSGLVATLSSTEEGISPTETSYRNIKALADISFRKVYARNPDRPLSGGSFQLSGTDYKGDAVLMTATSNGGIVTFKNVPIDNGDGYLIKELSPPPGYRLTTEILEARVQYNEDKTGVVVTLSENILTNRRASGGSSFGDDQDDRPTGDPTSGEDSNPDPSELVQESKSKDGILPKTGGAAPSFYLFLAGLAFLLAGLLFARLLKKKPHRNEQREG